MNRIVTLGLLPQPIRRQYRFGWTRRQQRMFDVLVPTLRTMRRVAPRPLALWPESRIAGQNRAAATRKRGLP
jgi:uncharacterized protein (DUF2236 family)